MTTNPDPDREPIIADATSDAPPKGMPPEVWAFVRRTVTLGVIANLAQITAFLRERETEADMLAEQHAEHGCHMTPIAMGVGMGVGASLAVIESMVEKASAILPPSVATMARQEGEKAAQARDPEHFHANPATLEKALREGFAMGARAHEKGEPLPIRPVSPLKGGTIH